MAEPHKLFFVPQLTYSHILSYCILFAPASFFLRSLRYLTVRRSELTVRVITPVRELRKNPGNFRGESFFFVSVAEVRQTKVHNRQILAKKG